MATEDLRLAAIAGALVEAYRAYGHLGARIDPLGSEPPRHPLLEPEYHGIRRDELTRVPASAVWLKHLGDNAAEVVDRLEEIYCGPIGYELDQMENSTQRDWLVDYIESHRHRLLMSRERAKACLEWLTRVEGLETFLHRTYLGKKRFSVEGLDVLVPMMRGIIGSAGAAWGAAGVCGNGPPWAPERARARHGTVLRVDRGRIRGTGRARHHDGASGARIRGRQISRGRPVPGRRG